MARIPLVGLEAAVRNQVPGMLREMADKLYQKMLENVTLTDHSLRELDLLGNPYGKKNPQEIHEPPYLVHQQGATDTGPQGHKIGTDLQDGLRVNIINQYRIQVGF